MKQDIPTAALSTSQIYEHLPALAVNAILVAAGGTFECSPENQAILDALLWETEREALVAAVERPSIAVCQTLILLGLKSHRMSRHHKTWQYIGMASRTVVSLGLHRDRPDDPDLQVKRRIFWVVYLVDKILGVELGRPNVLRRADSNAKLPSEDDMEEYEVVSRVFPVGSAPGPGRVLSTFNATARLAVICEKICDMRRSFPTPAHRAQAVAAIDGICVRWTELLPETLRSTEHSAVPMNVAGAFTLDYSCVVLLHISAATDALEANRHDDVSLKRIIEVAASWSKMMTLPGRRFLYNVQCALPITFPILLSATVNNLIGTPETLEANHIIMQSLLTHRERGVNLDSYSSMCHVINSIQSLIPSLPAALFGAVDEPFFRQPVYSDQDPWMLQEPLQYRPEAMGTSGSTRDWGLLTPNPPGEWANNTTPRAPEYTDSFSSYPHA
ncbi:hypothetical protein RQP46_004422 [Phenoliferia psychrophenolica]